MASDMKSFLKKLKGKKKDKPTKIFDVPSDVQSKYNLKDVIGKGTFSTVRIGENIETGKHVAVKIINKDNVDVKIESLKTEVKILMQVKHPNIVNLQDIFEDQQNVYMITDLMMGGEMFDRICNDHPMGYSEKTASELFEKLLKAIEYLHSIGIIHRDLKPENLLYASADDETDVRVTDFGLAKIYKDDIVVKTACGSPNYVAPEVLLHKPGGYTFSVDMWSLGVILYVLLCGFCPFYDEKVSKLYELITSGKYSFPSPYWDHISDSVKELISKLLEVDPEKRFTPRQALEHDWIKSNTSSQLIPNIVQNWGTFRGRRGFGYESNDSDGD